MFVTSFSDKVSFFSEINYDLTLCHCLYRSNSVNYHPCGELFGHQFANSHVVMCVQWKAVRKFSPKIM